MSYAFLVYKNHLETFLPVAILKSLQYVGALYQIACVHLHSIDLLTKLLLLWRHTFLKLMQQSQNGGQNQAGEQSAHVGTD